MGRQRIFGILLALVSAVFFALSNTLAGVAYIGGSNPFTLSATRFILPAVMLFLPLLFGGRTNSPAQATRAQPNALTP